MFHNKSSIKPPRALIYFKHIWGGEGGRGSFKLGKVMVSVLHKELEGKVEKLNSKKLKSCS